MKTVLEMAGEVLDRMAPDDHCRAPYWTATDEELERYTELVRADERLKLQGQIETLHEMYKLASRQRDQLMDQQSAQVAAMRGRIQ